MKKSTNAVSPQNDPSLPKMLALEEALERVLDGVSVLAEERVPLLSALGRTLAKAAHSKSPQPGFDNSAMDGYAARTSDFLGDGPWEISVRGESAAGNPASHLVEGTLCRIFTGAMIPEGADAIIMQENTELSTADSVRVLQAPKRNEHIRRKGDDLATGDLALPQGTLLDGFSMGLLASLGHDQVTVHRKPRVAILCTGDELRLPSEANRPGSICESNGVAIAGLATQAGAQVHLAPLLPDEPTAIRRAVSDAVANSDIVITIGGVSVGDHDHVRDALVAAGVQLNFWKVAIKPGKPLASGRVGNTAVLGLPGNPVSAQLTFGLFGIPLLRTLQGRPATTHEFSATLSNTVRQRPGRRSFVRATLTKKDSTHHVAPLKHQSSGSVASLAYANALIIVPEDCEALIAGTLVKVIRLDDLCR